LLSLFKCFNGNFVASTRLLFAMGRRGLLDPRVAAVHPANQTPATAVLAVGIATALCMFLGDAILVPVSEVGSVASATGWLAACAAYYAMGPPPRQRIVAALGVAVGLVMILMKVVPAIPGHFSVYEWLALAIWIALGVLLGMRAQTFREDRRVHC
jgi:APA family basic amino acid/polyamine antiporter